MGASPVSLEFPVSLANLHTPSCVCQTAWSPTRPCTAPERRTGTLQRLWHPGSQPFVITVLIRAVLAQAENQRQAATVLRSGAHSGRKP